jgi:hypothetical protein
MSESVAIATEATAKAAKQEDDEEDDKYEADRHRLSPFRGTTTSNGLCRRRSSSGFTMQSMQSLIMMIGNPLCIVRELGEAPFEVLKFSDLFWSIC